LYVHTLGTSLDFESYAKKLHRTSIGELWICHRYDSKSDPVGQSRHTLAHLYIVIESNAISRDEACIPSISSSISAACHDL